VTRYLKRDLRVGTWVEWLGLRQVPADLQILLGGQRRVALVKVAYLYRPSSAEGWLRAHARLVRRDRFANSGAEVLYFEPVAGATFFSGSAPSSPGKN
jgi:hypothetical protein